MTTIVDLDTGQVLKVAAGRDHNGVGALPVRPESGMAPGRSGFPDRPVPGVPDGAAIAAATRSAGAPTSGS